MSHLLAVAFMALSGLAWLYSSVRHRRFKKFAHLPQLKTSLLWGHLKAVHEYNTRSGEPQRQIDETLREMIEENGNPPILLLDLWPVVAYPLLCIASHEVAEQVSRPSKTLPYSVPKSPTNAFLLPLFGPRSLVISQGEEWKASRKRFNPGFAPHHLMSLMPCVVEKCEPFLAILDSLARSGEEFPLEDLCTNLTFDVIGAVTMDTDFGAQLPAAEQGDWIKLYKRFIATWSEDDGTFPLWSRPLTAYRRLTLERRIKPYLVDLVRRKFEDLQDGRAQRDRSVLALSLQDTDRLTPEIVDVTIDQLKTFLFAGHDTTSILLQWAIYELARSPAVYAKLVAELDDVFGPDPDPVVVMAAFVSRGDEVMQGLTYTSAVVKETLRLYPPAGTARMSMPGAGLHVRLPGGDSVCIDGTIIYNCATLIHRDESVYGATRDDFVPERWLGEADGETDEKDEGHVKDGSAGISPSAWRPFERGPRNCIGQELANIEAKVVLACVARRYDFVKVGRGATKVGGEGKPTVNEKGQYETTSWLFSRRQITARPVDGMRMQVKIRASA